MTDGKYNVVEGLLPLLVPIDTVKPDPKNVRAHPERNITAIKRSLERWGQRKPIVVHADTRIIEAGNGLWQAAKELGWTHIAAIFVEEPRHEARAYAIADNKTALLSDWDFVNLEGALEELRSIGYDLSLTGFTEDELTVLLTAGFEDLGGELGAADLDEEAELEGELAERYTVRLVFPTAEAANTWLEEHGFDRRFPKTGLTRQLVIYVD